MQFALILLKLLLMFIKSREQRLHDNDILSQAYEDVVRELDTIRLRATAARLAARKRLLDAAIHDGGESGLRDPFRLD